MAIKYYATLIEDPFYIQKGSFKEFQEFLKGRDTLQFDVETNVTNDVSLKVLRSVQFGEWNPSLPYDEKEQWFLEWDLLTPEEKKIIIDLVEDSKIKKVGHNIGYENMLMRAQGAWMNNVMDTMIREKIIYTGMSQILDEDGAQFFSLESVCRRRVNIELSKEYQTRFGHEEGLTVGHIIYGCQDVAHLDNIWKEQETQLQKYYPLKEGVKPTVYNHLPTLEDEATLAFSDITYNGMILDRDKWLELLAEAEPVIQDYLEELKKSIVDDEVLFQRAIDLGYYYREDTIDINWNSPVQRRELFQYAFPELEGATKPILKKWLLEAMKAGEDNSAQFKVISELYNGSYDSFENLLKEHCRDYLVERGYIIPAGTLKVNWNSPDQVPALLSCVKQIDSAKKEVLENFPHKVAPLILDYKQVLKLKSTYGEDFLQHVDADGRVRTSFNQILETGRVSSSKPNMQQIPAYERVGNKYRNCFVPLPGYKIVDSDYSSQELVIIAEISNDPVWKDALSKGHDLHSVTAELVYKQKWHAATEEGCVYKAGKEKCSCKGHKRLRTGIKSINFGLAYGMSEYKLAADMRISVKEAKALIDEYFRTFPAIGSKLTQLGWYAITYGHIMTLEPYRRKRFYPTWQAVAKYREAHMKGIRYNGTLGSIERTGKNTPIQGTAADMMKLALVMCRRFLIQKKLQNEITLIMQVHDQLTTMCPDRMAEGWANALTKLMEKAALNILPSGTLKAETNITDVWSK